MVLSIEAKRNGSHWEAYYDNGRERSGLDAIEWARKGQELGAGEILLTSVDQEGTAKGYDVELVRTVSGELEIPIIASGGMGELTHLDEVVWEGGADAVAMAHVLHYGTFSVEEIRNHCLKQGIPVRTVPEIERWSSK